MCKKTVPGEKGVFKITLFSKKDPTLLAENLTSIRFKKNPKNNDVYWEGESGESFVISPFKRQSRNGINGYRITSTYPISTILYFIDGAFGWIDDMKISGVEYETPLTKSKGEHLKELVSSASLDTIDSRGIFLKNDVSIVLLQDSFVLQRRSKLKKLNVELKKIESVRDLILPNDFDLFSFMDSHKAI